LPRESPPGFPEARDEAEGHWVGPGVEHDRHALCGALHRESGRSRQRPDEVNLFAFQTPRRHFRRFEIAFDVAHVEEELLALLKSQLPETVP
jgi:hypothetical protein